MVTGLFLPTNLHDLVSNPATAWDWLNDQGRLPALEAETGKIVLEGNLYWGAHRPEHLAL